MKNKPRIFHRDPVTWTSFLFLRFSRYFSSRFYDVAGYVVGLRCMTVVRSLLLIFYDRDSVFKQWRIQDFCKGNLVISLLPILPFLPIFASRPFPAFLSLVPFPPLVPSLLLSSPPLSSPPITFPSRPLSPSLLLPQYSYGAWGAL